MTNRYPSLSEDQVRAADLLDRLEGQRTTRFMAKCFFWVLIALFVVNSGFLLYAAFAMNGAAITKSVSVAFDGLFGYLLRLVGKHLFPPRCKDGQGVVREINPPAAS